jgi:hypothetical protein
MVNKKMNYDWKITIKKGLVSLSIVLISGFISVYANEPKYLVLIPIAEMALNWLKHRKD